MAKGVDPALIGRTIAGKFAIDSYIGAGAMGAVYKARQVALEKLVAVKVLHRELTSDESFTFRFKREAKAASRLDHPNSMRVIDFGIEPDGLLYIAMELLDGRDLLKVIVEDWPLSAPRIAGILMQALAALAVAHDMGVVHRDLKPENIMILEGTSDEGQKTDMVKVCDFGIAKITQPRSEKVSQAGGPDTAQGLVVGTPEYMSPEQGKGEKLDHRSDLYSMGVILYQLLTGRVPFDAESALGIVFKHVTEEPVRPTVINPVADRRLETICLKAMSKRREDRQQSAREMRMELRTLFDGTTSAPIPAMSVAAQVDDTSPLPAMDQAKTTPLPALSATSHPAGTPDPLPKTTSSATAFLGEGIRTSRPPSPLLLGVATAALGGLMVFAFMMHGGSSPETAAAAPMSAPLTATATASAEDSSSGSPAAGASAPPEASSESPTATASSHGSHPRSTAAQSAPASPGPTAATSPPAGGAAGAAGAAGGSTSFNLALASASASVIGANGATAHDVRAALPSSQFTVCYRDALKRLGRRVEGKMKIHLKMGGDGHVTSALVTAPQSLTESMGSCITDSVNQLPVSNVAPTGGDADISIVFVPE